MPLVKIFVDDGVAKEAVPRLCAGLPDLRLLICNLMKVDLALCQISIVPCFGLPDQAQVSVEVNLLRHPDRTKGAVQEACSLFRDAIQRMSSVASAVRANMMDGANYVVIR